MGSSLTLPALDLRDVSLLSAAILMAVLSAYR
jgi:hypothetical protein